MSDMVVETRRTKNVRAGALRGGPRGAVYFLQMGPTQNSKTEEPESMDRPFYPLHPL